MELIKSSNSITSAIPKIVETPKHFSLNTQLYNKLSFKPYPMRFFTRNIGPALSLYSSINKISSFYPIGYYMTDALYDTEHNHINIIQDKNEHDIFYAIRPSFVDSECYTIEKTRYDEVTMDYTILNTVSIRSITGKARNIVKVLHEFDNAFVLFGYGRDTGSGTASPESMIGILDKKTFGITVINEGDDRNQYTLAAVDNNLYILRVNNTNLSVGAFYINKLNIDTKAYTNIFEYTQPTNLLTKRTTCNPVKIGNDFYMLFTYLEENVHYYKIMKTTLDTNTDTVSTELIDIDLKGFVLDETNNLNYGFSLYHTLRVIESEGNTYLSLLIHLQPNHVTGPIYKVCKHVLIKVHDNTFTVIDEVKLTDGCFGSLEYIDSKHQIFFTSNSILFYTFNASEEKMILTHKRAGTFSQVGLDSLNRIITLSNDGSLEIITEGNASILKADFAEDIYNKNRNDNIESVVNFYAKNFLDEYVDTEVKLTLIGPVTFKENDSQVLVTSSSDEGIKTIPVIISGFGNIEVIITQNT